MENKQRIRSWCIVINNFTSSDVMGITMLLKQCEYAIYGKEVGEEGTPHIQGYIRLRNGITFMDLKNKLPRAHLQPANGSDMDNKEYCSKGQQPKDEWEELRTKGPNYGLNADVKEHGVPSKGQGSRTDIKDLWDYIKAERPAPHEVMELYPELYCKYNRSIKEMCQKYCKHRTEQPEIYWRWGLAGVGKTRYIFDNYNIDDIYVKDGTPWWDGYYNQKVILFDDFENTIPFRTLLRILDRNPIQGQCKGAYLNINSPIIYITCEFPPDKFWSGNTLQQVLRRIKSVELIGAIPEKEE